MSSRIIPHSPFPIPNSQKRGALLLELLIVIALLAIILGIGVQAVYVSMQSGKVSGERDVALGLASEALEAARAVVEEKWQNIYLLTKSSQHYKPALSGSAWTLAEGDDTVVLNNASYTRYLVVRNVCRETTSTRNIIGATDTDGSLLTCVDSGGVFDPSTQKITVTTSWQGGDPIVISEYFFRWRNKATSQTSWTGTGDESVSPPGSLVTGGTLHL